MVKEIELRATAIFEQALNKLCGKGGLSRHRRRNEHKNQCEVTLGKTGLCAWLRGIPTLTRDAKAQKGLSPTGQVEQGSCCPGELTHPSPGNSS